MHRIYALKYTEASQTFNQFSNMKKNPSQLFLLLVLVLAAAAGYRLNRPGAPLIPSGLVRLIHNNRCFDYSLIDYC